MANYQLKSGEKARTVTTIVWVEDLERRYGEHWQRHFYGYLADLRIPVCCSPVHDHDTYTDEDVSAWRRRHIDPDTGEVATEYTNQEPRVGDPKKAHIHIIVITKGPMFREDFSQLFYDLIYIKVTAWEKVLHLDTLTRYMAHMDNKEKYQYNFTDIISFGGFSLKPISIQKTDEYTKASALVEVLTYCEDNKITKYHVLVKWAKTLGDYDVFACVTGRASFFAAYFRSIQDEIIERRESEKKKKENSAKK